MPSALLLAAFACAPLAVQDPPAPAAPPKDAATLAWEAWQQRCAAAQGLDIAARVLLVDGLQDPDLPDAPKMEIAARLARKAAGRGSWVTRFRRGEEEERIVLEWVGDGERVYSLDHDEKKAHVEGGEWKTSEFGFYLPFLGPTWSEGALLEPAAATAAAPADHPDWTGLQVRGRAPGAEPEDPPVGIRLWTDVEGALRRVETEMGGSALLRFEIGRLVLSAEAKPEELAARPPEGYEIVEPEPEPASSLEDSLPAVGAAAPEATLIGPDGAPFLLSSLRGRTVLLNFWFFH